MAVLLLLHMMSVPINMINTIRLSFVDAGGGGCRPGNKRDCCMNLGPKASAVSGNVEPEKERKKEMMMGRQEREED
jgi:hypothetical protein